MPVGDISDGHLKSFKYTSLERGLCAAWISGLARASKTKDGESYTESIKGLVKRIKVALPL